MTNTADDIIVAYGGAQPGDLHTLSTVRAIDDGIFAFLQRREGRRRQNLMSKSSERTVDVSKIRTLEVA
jgi:hypothetical protein